MTNMVISLFLLFTIKNTKGQNMIRKNTIIKLCKYVGLVILMYCCALSGVVLYPLGFGTDLFIMLLIPVLVYIAYINTSKIISLIVLYLNLLISVYLGVYFSTRLFYEKINSDDMSLILGNVSGKILLAITVILIFIFLLIRYICIRAQKTSS